MRTRETNPDNVERIVKYVQSEVSSFTDGIMLVGSAAYGASDPNDLDFVLVSHERDLANLSRKAGNLISSLDPYSEDKLTERARYPLHGQSFKGRIEDMQVSLWVYPPTLMTLLVNPDLTAAGYVRETPNVGDATLYNIEGETIKRPITNQQLPSGLIVAEEPNFATCGGLTYIGVVPDAFLKRPRILFDPRETIKDRLDRLWDNVLGIIKKELDSASAQRLIGKGKLPLIRRQVNFKRELYEHMKYQLGMARERKIE